MATLLAERIETKLLDVPITVYRLMSKQPGVSAFWFRIPGAKAKPPFRIRTVNRPRGTFDPISITEVLPLWAQDSTKAALIAHLNAVAAADDVPADIVLDRLLSRKLGVRFRVDLSQLLPDQRAFFRELQATYGDAVAVNYYLTKLQYRRLPSKFSDSKRPQALIKRIAPPPMRFPASEYQKLIAAADKIKAQTFESGNTKVPLEEFLSCCVKAITEQRPFCALDHPHKTRISERYRRWVSSGRWDWACEVAGMRA